MPRRTTIDLSPQAIPLAVSRDARQDSSLLLRQFREFYREVIRLRKAVEQTADVGVGEPLAMGASATIGGGMTTTTSTSTSTSTWTPSLVQPVWQQLLSILERQALEAGQTG